MTTRDSTSPSDIESEEYRSWKNHLHIEEIYSNEIAKIDKDDDWKTKYLKSKVSFVNHASSLAYMEQQRKLRIQLISMEASLLEQREYYPFPVVEKVDIATSPIKELPQSPMDTLGKRQSCEQQLNLEFSFGEVEEDSGIKLVENLGSQIVKTVISLPTKESCDDASTHGVSNESLDEAPSQILDAADSTINTPHAVPEPVSISTRSSKSRTKNVLPLNAKQDDNTHESQHPSSKACPRKKIVHDEPMNDKENENNDVPTLKKKSKNKSSNDKTAKVTTRRKKTQECDPGIDIFFDKNHVTDMNIEGLNHSTKDISPIKPRKVEEQSITDTSESSLKLDCSLDEQSNLQRHEITTKSKRKQNILATFQAPVLKKKFRERK
jgi:hypothetical protein